MVADISTSTQKRNELVEKQQQELKNLRDEYQKKEKEIRDSGEATISHIRKDTADQAAQVQTQANSRLVYERDQAQQTIQRQRQTSQQQMSQQKTDDEMRLQSLTKADQQSFKHERELNENEAQKLRDQSRYDQSELRKMDDEKLSAEEQRFRSRHERLKADDQEQIKKEQASNEQEIKKQNGVYQEKNKKNNELYEKELARQRLEFDTKFKINDKQNTESLSSQHDRLVNQLNQQKLAITREYGKNLDRKNDPFYQVVKPETTLSEDEHYFLVKTKIPEADKDNVDVRVLKNKVVVAGKRSFNEHIDEADRKIVTNNFQSFREELPLSQPVVEKVFTKHYENGVLTIKIPKIGHA